MPDQVWMYIGIFSSVLAAVMGALMLWRRRELRRYRAITLAAEFSKWGLGDTFGKLFMAYAVGNYLGKDSVARVVGQIIIKIKTQGLPMTMAKLFWKLVVHFAKDPDNRKRITGIIEQQEAAQSQVDKGDPEVDDDYEEYEEE